METGVNAWDVSRCLLHSLHPTPAVCGFPLEDAQKFIRAKESLAFDRGFYAGPFGYVGGTQAEIVVAIRSGLITKMKDSLAAEKQTRLSVFAGAGIVPGSTVQGEWAETSYKLNVISTLFPQSPIRLLGAATPNVAWATAFVEELIRCGVRQFYVCPGSRSTPLVAALSKALRSNVGVVAASSVHDERGAAFRALGYAKGYGRPAAVITSSGTATANLYPAIMEAGIDGIPMLLLTADRPYESRDTGANQAVDQVKVYSSTYLRWFRDIPPPSDDIPVSLVLSDANHAVKTAVQQKGPVHINIQFRENLAPDAGSIRNDNRVDSVVKFNGYRFTDVPNFHRWSYGGDKWVSSFHSSSVMFGVSDESVFEVARLIRESKRGIIVVGNLHPHSGQEIETQVEAITDFASVIGYPIFAGVQSGSLRCRSPAVIFYAEHLLKAPMVSRNMKPDLIIQLGHPLISTEVPKLIRESMKDSESSRKSIQHVLIHPIGQERAEADEFTVTHRITADIAPFLESVVSAMERYTEDISSVCSSELASLVLLGRMLGEKMPSIIDDASEKVIAQASDDKMLGGETTLTEPQVVMAMSESLQSAGRKYPIFLSNSMPVRDAEFFLYPMVANSLGPIGVNRGASGIDGIVSTALGFAESYEAHIALLIGDLAAIHDLNSFHSLSKSQPGSSRRSPPLTTVVVNNDGGGIFSFLPISKYGKEVNYEDFFGTPTNSFSFEKGAEAFGLPFESARSPEEFRVAFASSLRCSNSTIVEAKVVARDINVQVHREIATQASCFITNLLDQALARQKLHESLAVKTFSVGQSKSKANETLLLLHGWMGDMSDWEEVVSALQMTLPENWSIIAVNLPGHGGATPDMAKILTTLGLDDDSGEAASGQSILSIDSVAESVMKSVAEKLAIESVSAIAGYR
jgi:2-succinyl-5-enolpyruvyl-6-hydroxy-3-cyclohexene-1-carboxylate synthase